MEIVVVSRSDFNSRRPVGSLVSIGYVDFKMAPSESFSEKTSDIADMMDRRLKNDLLYPSSVKTESDLERYSKQRDSERLEEKVMSIINASKASDRATRAYVVVDSSEFEHMGSVIPYYSKTAEVFALI